MNATIRPSETVEPTSALAAQQQPAADTRDERHGNVAERLERRLQRAGEGHRANTRVARGGIGLRKRLDVLVFAIEGLRLTNRRQVLLQIGVDVADAPADLTEGRARLTREPRRWRRT